MCAKSLRALGFAGTRHFKGLQARSGRQRRAQHPELLLELAHDLDQDVLGGEVDLPEPVHAPADALADVREALDELARRGVGGERSGVDRGDPAALADGGGLAVGRVADCDRPLGDGIGELPPRVDELVEVLVERLERPAEDVPVRAPGSRADRQP